MDQMIYYLTQHCLVYNIIFGNGFECAEILYADMQGDLAQFWIFFEFSIFFQIF